MSTRPEVADHLRGLAERLGALGEAVAGAKNVLDEVEGAPSRAVANYSALSDVERGLAQVAAELEVLAEQLETDEP